MPISEKGVRELLRASKDLGLDLSDAIPAFGWYYDLLLKGNESVNLTALSREDDIVHKHFVDSLSCFLSGKLEGSLDVIDVGTGAGFPGIPLAIARPELSLTLLDATRKKVEFVGRVCQGLGLSNAHAVWGRAEALGQQPAHRERYDRVVTRAVSSLSSLYELCLPLLKVGGYLIAQKGSDADAEAARAASAGEKLGGEIVEVMPFRLPITGDPRSLVIVEKVTPTPGNYPRRPGVPQKNPLS